MSGRNWARARERDKAERPQPFGGDRLDEETVAAILEQPSKTELRAELQTLVAAFEAKGKRISRLPSRAERRDQFKRRIRETPPEQIKAEADRAIADWHKANGTRPVTCPGCGHRGAVPINTRARLVCSACATVITTA